MKDENGILRRELEQKNEERDRLQQEHTRQIKKTSDERDRMKDENGILRRALVQTNEERDRLKEEIKQAKAFYLSAASMFAPLDVSKN